MRVEAAEHQPIGTLPDGTPFFAPLGELLRHGEERVVCHLCGRHLEMLGGTHLRVAHGWTLAAYREVFQLHQHVPTCSLDLSDRYRGNARARIGDGGFADPPADPPRPPRRAPAWRSLAAIRPDLVAELHPTRNRNLDVAGLAVGSRRSLWWQCPACGHAWRARVENRTRRGSGCPLCSGQRRAATQSRVSPERSLAVLRPELAAELHRTRNDDLDARGVGIGSTRKVWWKCSVCGHAWQAVVANRARGTGCPACWQRRRSRPDRA